VATSPTEAWSFISGLHRQRVSYNLVALPGRLYCMPRRIQGSFCHAPWNSGYAWYELAGGVTTVDRGDFEALNKVLIEQELELLRLHE